MKEKNFFKAHTCSLIALFILGNAIIKYPIKSADEYTFFAFIISFITALLLYFICLPIINVIFSREAENKSNKFIRILRILIFLFIAVTAVFLAAEVFIDFTNFSLVILLPKTAKFITYMLFLLSVIAFALRRQEVILKFSLISCFIVGIIVLFFFISSIENFNYQNIFVFKIPKFENFIIQYKPYFLNPVLPSLLIGVYEKNVFGKIRVKMSVLGIIVGFSLLALCILNAVLIFGTDLSGTLQYPYASAVSTVTIGRLFTRMDGFSYFIYFAAALVKITVYIFIVKTMLKKIKKLIEYNFTTDKQK